MAEEGLFALLSAYFGGLFLLLRHVTIPRDRSSACFNFMLFSLKRFIADTLKILTLRQRNLSSFNALGATFFQPGIPV